MDVTNTTAASVPASSTQPQAPAPKSEKQPQEQQNSVVVKLSEQAQQMNRAESQNNTERAETKAKETAEPSGIQFIEGESKSGRINTYA